MQVIVTTFEPDEAQRPGIVAVWGTKSIRIPYERTLSLDDNHAAAAERLARNLGWRRQLAFGQLPTGDYCHVPLVEERIFSTADAPSTASPPEYVLGRDGHMYHRRTL